jgi:hypothetical protein
MRNPKTEFSTQARRDEAGTRTYIGFPAKNNTRRSE